MATKISAAELAEKLPDVLSRVQNQGERFTVERNGEAVASLGPVSEASIGITVQELVDRLGSLELPGGGFADDLAAVQAAQPPAEASRWPN